MTASHDVSRVSVHTVRTVCVPLKQGKVCSSVTGMPRKRIGQSADSDEVDGDKRAEREVSNMQMDDMAAANSAGRYAMHVAIMRRNTLCMEQDPYPTFDQIMSTISRQGCTDVLVGPAQMSLMAKNLRVFDEYDVSSLI